jgi:hypothetical protein
MNNYIYNEQLTPTADWTNKIFYTTKNISNIVWIYFWWAIYRNISFSNNQIILSEAPPAGTNLFIDYFEDEITPLITSSVTFKAVIDDIYSKISPKNLSSAQKVFNIDQVKLWINTELKRLRNEKLYTERTQILTFNISKKTTPLRYMGDWILVDSTIKYKPSSSRIMLWNDIYNYSSIDDNKIIVNLTIIYDENTPILFWYALPLWLKRVSEILVNWQPLTYLDSREFNWNNNLCYTIIDNYIYCSTPIEWLATVVYMPEYNMLTLDWDLIDIEYEYFEILSYATLYKLFKLREDSRYPLMKEDYDNLKRDYKIYKSKNFWVNNKFRSNIMTNIW